jgi:hypothetical protein
MRSSNGVSHRKKVVSQSLHPRREKAEHTSPSAVSSSSPAVSRAVKPTDLQRRKHIRDPDEEDEARRNRGSKRPRKRFGPDSPRPLGFACPFYRKDPEKYVVATDIKYRTCGGPRPYEVRRIKCVTYQKCTKFLVEFILTHF